MAKIELQEILDQHEAFYTTFDLATHNEVIRTISLSDLSDFNVAITAWNSDVGNADNKIEKIGIYPTYDADADTVTSYLIVLDVNGIPIEGPGGGGEGPPHYQ